MAASKTTVRRERRQGTVKWMCLVCFKAANPQLPGDEEHEVRRLARQRRDAVGGGNAYNETNARAETRYGRLHILWHQRGERRAGD